MPLSNCKGCIHDTGMIPCALGLDPDSNWDNCPCYDDEEEPEEEIDY